MTMEHSLELGIVQIPQEHSLFPDMTVRENMELGGQILRQRSRIQQRLHQIEEKVPLVKERAKELARSLSGGPQRQIEIARGLIVDSTLVLADEPSMILDPQTLAQDFETIQ